MKKLIITFLLAIFVLSCTAFASVVDSGECGDNLTWTLDDAGTLTISGEGDMWHNDSLSDGSPWHDYVYSIKNVIIEDGVTSIGDYAFYCCSYLTDIIIPDSVTSIGRFVFMSCHDLTNITIPNGVTSIEACAFYACEKLTNITIPNGVTSIGYWAFCDCDSLTSIDIPSSVTSIGPFAFNGCENLETVYFCGSEDEWKNIDIGSENGDLLNANIIFVITEPKDTGDKKRNRR